MKRIRPDAGFTLIELLVGLGLMGIVLAALVAFFGQSARESSQSSARAELQQEALNTQQFIAGRLREAWYIYPTGQTLNLAGTGLNSRVNPITNTTSWTTGTHPILAMILRPQSAATGVCDPTTAAGQVFCYRFFAYFPVLRSVWVAAAPTASHPGVDTTNASTWVMAEYRAFFPATFMPTSYPPAVPTPPNTGNANLLADYVQPTTQAATYTMFEFFPQPNVAGATVTGVNLGLVNIRTVGGKTTRLPATGRYTMAVYPSNLGKFVSAP